MLDSVIAMAARLRAVQRASVGPAWRALGVALLVLALFGAAHLARLGTFRARLAAGSAVGVVALSLVGAWVVARRRRRDPPRAGKRRV